MPMEKETWERPQLMLLVRTMPEDGVLQLQTCKFGELAGPGPGDCDFGGIGGTLGGFEVGGQQNCEALVIS
jgi:hypothetical protein